MIPIHLGNSERFCFAVLLFLVENVERAKLKTEPKQTTIIIVTGDVRVCVCVCVLSWDPLEPINHTRERKSIFDLPNEIYASFVNVKTHVARSLLAC